MKPICLLIVLYVGKYYCATINDTNVLLNDLLDGYNKNIRPVENQDDVLYVNATLYFNGIQELDELTGTFSVTGAFGIRWYDDNIVWNPNVYGDIRNVLISYTDVWVPELILTNPAEESDALGRKWQMVFYQNNGYASWWPETYIRSICNLNMNKYPFDTQECIITFNAWGLQTGLVRINLDKEVNLNFYTENGAWKIIKTESKTVFRGARINFHIHLKRNSGFVVVNVILPLSFLSLLNVFIFLLRPESGERISYCITVLLSIAVFMTIVSDTLPQSSEPVPFISYKLIFDMVISSLMTLITILNLRLYHKDDTEPIPRRLQTVYFLFKFKCSKSKIQPEHVITVAEKKNHTNRNIKRHHHVDQQQSNHTVGGNKGNVTKTPLNVANFDDISDLEIVPEVTWKDISSLIDGIAFVVFSLLSLCSFATFMIITS